MKHRYYVSILVALCASLALAAMEQKTIVVDGVTYHELMRDAQVIYYFATLATGNHRVIQRPLQEGASALKQLSIQPSVSKDSVARK
jgi:hypothetical protein